MECSTDAAPDAADRRLHTGRRGLLVGGASLALALVALTLGGRQHRAGAMLQLGDLKLVPLGELVPVAGRQQGIAAAANGGTHLQFVDGQELFGGQGLVTTGTHVDGRKTVPGLHTDCVPGVLSSDCSPAQEDGAWSTDAMNYLDSQTGGAHSKSMKDLQADVDEAYRERDQFLQDCLTDAANCNKPAQGRFAYHGDTPTWGSRGHPWAPEQGQDFGQYDNDGHWNHIPVPSGAKGDGTIVSDSYYAGALNGAPSASDSYGVYS